MGSIITEYPFIPRLIAIIIIRKGGRREGEEGETKFEKEEKKG